MTPAQKTVLDFIKKFWDEHGFAPSYRIVADGLAVKSVSGVHRKVHELAAGGWLEMRPGKARTIKPTNKV
jgi:repressor LexA